VAGLALLALLLLPTLAGAQTNGLISGTVTDKSGAAVVGANVTIVSTGGNLTRTTVTNGDGVYVASALPPGTYNITVTAKGFQKFEAKGFVLEVAQKARLDVALTVGAINEEVLVSGENVAQVDTQSSEIGSTITGKQVQELELNGRNFTQLVTLVPGVISQSGQDEGTVGIAGNTMYSINGGRGQYNNWEIDGGDNMDNGSNNSINVYPNWKLSPNSRCSPPITVRSMVRTVPAPSKSKPNLAPTSSTAAPSITAATISSMPTRGKIMGLAWPAPPTKSTTGLYRRRPGLRPSPLQQRQKENFLFWSQEWRREIVPGQNIAQAVPSSDELKGNFNDVCPCIPARHLFPTPSSLPLPVRPTRGALR